MFNLVDIWRKFHLRSREVSWFNSDFPICTHLLKFFVSRDFADSVSICDIMPCCFSDHDFVDLHFNLMIMSIIALDCGNLTPLF